MNDRKVAYLLLAPALVVLTALVTLPLLGTVYYSLFDLKLGQDRGEFVGLANYTVILGSQGFWQAFGITLAWIVGSVVPQVVIGTAIAIGINRLTHAKRTIRALIFLPWVLPVAVLAFMWRWLLTPETGLVPQLAATAGLDSIASGNFLTAPDTALPAALVVSAWRGIPFIVVMTLAALQGINEDDYHAAKVCGAGPFQCLWHVTIPYLLPMAMVLAVIKTMQLANNYSLMALLTGGGPAESTKILPIMIYETAFRDLQLGRASAIGVIALALTGLGIALILRRRDAK